MHLLQFTADQETRSQQAGPRPSTLGPGHCAHCAWHAWGTAGRLTPQVLWEGVDQQTVTEPPVQTTKSKLLFEGAGVPISTPHTPDTGTHRFHCEPQHTQGPWRSKAQGAVVATPLREVLWSLATYRVESEVYTEPWLRKANNPTPHCPDNPEYPGKY